MVNTKEQNFENIDRNINDISVIDGDSIFLLSVDIDRIYFISTIYFVDISNPISTPKMFRMWHPSVTKLVIVPIIYGVNFCYIILLFINISIILYYCSLHFIFL